jgi:hypothetical protein
MNVNMQIGAAVRLHKQIHTASVVAAIRENSNFTRAAVMFSLLVSIIIIIICLRCEDISSAWMCPALRSTGSKVIRKKLVGGGGGDVECTSSFIHLLCPFSENNAVKRRGNASRFTTAAARTVVL